MGRDVAKLVGGGMKKDWRVSTEGRNVASVGGAGVVWGVFDTTGENSRGYRAVLTMGRGVSAIGREVIAEGAAGETARGDFIADGGSSAGNRMSIAGVSS